MIYDCHSHLDYYPPKKIEKVIKNAKKSKVKIIIANSLNLNSLKKIFEISKKYSMVKIAAGLYPEEDLTLKKYNEFEEFVLRHKKDIIAIGEIGLDSTEKLNMKTQEIIFRKQLNLTRKLKLPVIIHSRKAEQRVLEILQEYPKLTKIMHCFCGKLKLINKVDKNTYFSIPTNVVRSEQFQKMLTVIPKSRILTETDTPFLSPYKDIRDNESAFIKESIKIISKIWEVSKKETEKQIEENFKWVFKE